MLIATLTFAAGLGSGIVATVMHYRGKAGVVTARELAVDVREVIVGARADQLRRGVDLNSDDHTTGERPIVVSKPPSLAGATVREANLTLAFQRRERERERRQFTLAALAWSTWPNRT